jgi:hypothetical protein
MMRRFAQFLLVACFLALSAVAQRGGGGFHGGMGRFHGGMGGFRGGGAFRGGMGGFHGGMGGIHHGGFVGPGFRGGFNGGFRGFRGGFHPGNRFVFGFPGYWPYYGAGWGYPYYDYSYYYPYSTYPYSYTYSYPSHYAYVYSAPAQTSCPQANGTPLFLIKLTYENDVWVARDYWYTAGTLNFITVQGELKKTPISSIDRGLTFQLNRDCGVNFQLAK